MIVTRVREGRGSHIEPPLDPDWHPLTKLRWKAAVVALDADLPVDVHEVEPGEYSVSVGFSSISAMPYRDAWMYIAGVLTGAEQVHRATA